MSSSQRLWTGTLIASLGLACADATTPRNTPRPSEADAGDASAGGGDPRSGGDEREDEADAGDGDGPADASDGTDGAAPAAADADRDAASDGAGGDAEPAVIADWYVAPTALGDGLGRDRANAARYRDAGFWAAVQVELARRDVTVWFLDGSYHEATLALTALGRDGRVLTLRGESDAGAVFDGTLANAMTLAACKHLRLVDLNFTGGLTGYGLTITASGGVPSHHVVVSSCTFTDLPDITYGAMGAHRGSFEITVEDCTFRRVGKSSGSHMLYNAYDAHHLYVRNNLLEDCAGAYLRYRDNTDFTWTTGNVFRSTGSYAPEDATRTIFVHVPTYNDVNPGDELLSANHVITDNTFEFAGGPAGRRTALAFAHAGYDPPGFGYLLTAEEGRILTEGSPAAQRAQLLACCGLDLRLTTLTGNRYTNAEHRATFSSYASYGAVSLGWASFADITAAVAARPVFADDFETTASDFAPWTVGQTAGVGCASFEETTVAEGGRSVRLVDGSATGNCYLRRPQPELTSGYVAGWYRFVGGSGNHFCFYTGDNPYNYWIVARNDGTWGNSAGAFGGAPTRQDGVWYHLEAVFDHRSGLYDTWVDGEPLARGVPIPNATGTTRGYFYVNAASVAATGEMLVDGLEVADLFELMD